MINPFYITTTIHRCVSSYFFGASLETQIVKNLPAMQETRVQFLGRHIPWKRGWQPPPVFLPGEFHGQRSQVGYSPWGRKESNRRILLF